MLALGSLALAYLLGSVPFGLVIGKAQGIDLRKDRSTLERFTDHVNDDLNTPRALAVIWDLVKSDLDAAANSVAVIQGSAAGSQSGIFAVLHSNWS